MKTNSLLVLAFSSALALSSAFGQNLITATNSGNWSDTNIWNSGTVPGINDAVYVPAGFAVTVDTNEVVQFITGSGSVTMGPNTSLNVFSDSSISPTITFDASARGNTVIYSCNPWDALECNYYNLMLADTNYVDAYPPYYAYQNFNNFSQYGPTPMHIFGDMTLLGSVAVQQGSGGAPITIDGNLIIGTNCVWDSSGDLLTVASNIVCYGLLEDLNAALGNNYVGGNVIICGPGPSGYNPSTGLGLNGWNVSDVTNWIVGGSVTNNGYIYGGGYGCIYFNGAGTIGGSNILTLPTIKINGTYAIATTIMLTTNNADLNGTVIFDLANTNQIYLRYNATGLQTQTNYYAGKLIVINSGAAPVPGKSYQFFNAAHYAGAFASESLPGLPPGEAWLDNLAASGSISVTGGPTGAPTITLTRNGAVLTLTWDSTAFPGFSVQAQTNGSGLGSTWAPTGSGTTSPYSVTMNPTNPSVFYRLSNP